MKEIPSFLFGVTTGIWISYFSVEYRLNIKISDLKENKTLCEKSLPRDQECVMAFDFVPVKKEKSE